MVRKLRSLIGCRMFAKANGWSEHPAMVCCCHSPSAPSSWAARRPHPPSLFTLSFLFFASSSLHFTSPPIPLSPFWSHRLGASFFCTLASGVHLYEAMNRESARQHHFEEVYVHRLFVRFAPSPDSSLEPVFDLRQRSPFRRVSSFFPLSHYNDLAD